MSFLLSLGEQRDVVRLFSFVCLVGLSCFPLLHLLKQNKIMLLSGLALLYKEMQFTRKFALCMYEMAGLYEQIHLLATKEKLLASLGRYYQLPGLDQVPSAEPVLDSLGRDIAHRRGWWDIQCRVMRELCAVSLVIIMGEKSTTHREREREREVREIHQRDQRERQRDQRWRDYY